MRLRNPTVGSFFASAFFAELQWHGDEVVLACAGLADTIERRARGSAGNGGVARDVPRLANAFRAARPLLTGRLYRTLFLPSRPAVHRILLQLEAIATATARAAFRLALVDGPLPAETAALARTVERGARLAVASAVALCSTRDCSRQAGGFSEARLLEERARQLAFDGTGRLLDGTRSLREALVSQDVQVQLGHAMDACVGALVEARCLALSGVMTVARERATYCH